MAEVIQGNNAGLVDYKKLSIEVHKFGGSSLASAKHIQQVANLVASETMDNDIIIVSANGNVTENLIRVSRGFLEQLDEVHNYLSKISLQLGIANKDFKSILDEDITFIKKSLSRDLISQHQLLAYGEKWSSLLLSCCLQDLSINAIAIDSCELLKLNSISEQEAFDLRYADIGLTKIYNSHSGTRFVITGFVAKNEKGQVITLGANGSDYSATIISQMVKAKSVTIWSDVNGIYSADPNIISQAIKIDQLSFCEAQALSELGANVLHQQTIAPLLKYKTDAYIKSSYLQKSSGTKISKEISKQKQVKTVTIKQNLNKIIVTNVSRYNAGNLQQKILQQQIASYANHYDKTLERLTLYVKAVDLFSTISIVKASGYYPISEKSSRSLISLVGQNIRQSKDVISKFLSRIEKFSIDEIYYPSNSHTICAIIDDTKANDLLIDLHNTFFLLEPSIPIVVLGYGKIGKQFISILKANKNSIEQSINRSLSLLAIANSRFYSINENCLTQQNNGHEYKLHIANQNNELINNLQQYKGKELVVVDLTASREIAALYPKFAANSWHIISANKIAASDNELAKVTENELRNRNRRWLKNTTVGAGLPIQTCVQKLVESGDKVEEVSGIFSGSLSWLFGQYDGSKPFTKLIEEAKSNAFTEPDPREDLSGNDVIKKIRILARELGFFDAEEQFEAAIDSSLLEGNLENFYSKSALINDYYQELHLQAQKVNGVIRYIACLNKSKLSLKLIIIDASHPFANLNPCDNIFSISSGWYQQNPLIIQGPGAGREVTAAGVLNDLCDLLKRV